MAEQNMHRPRRTPRQERSRRHVNAILDAATLVFAEVGYDAATTNAIAERAGTSIGSLYQFFPHKAALFHAVTERYHSQLRELLDRVVTVEVAQRPLADMIDRVIEAFWSFTQQQQGFTQIILSTHLSPELQAQENALLRESIERVDAILGVRAPALSPERRRLIATVVLHAVNALLMLGAISEPSFGTQVIGETKALVQAYLERVLNNEHMEH